MSRITALGHNHMRGRNLAVILSALQQSTPISRSGLARLTGLHKASITSLINQLEGSGFIRELELIPSENAGRPATGLGLNPDAGSIISVEIGVDYISAIVTDFTTRILWRHHEDADSPMDQNAILSQSFEIAEEARLVAQALPGRLFGIAWGVPGLVNVETGTLLFAPNLGWADVPFRDLVTAKFDIPTHVDNEAKLAALGEATFGTARSFDYVIYVSSGIGIGGGIVIDGQVISGASGFAGEIGHMTVDPEGFACNCGNHGCWETLASEWALFRRIREAIDSRQPTSLSGALSSESNLLTVPIIVDAAREGDSIALNALRETGQWLGIGIANLINGFNPHGIVLGGNLSLAHEFLMPEIQDVVKQRAAVYRATLGQILNWTSIETPEFQRAI
jgi:glucokinase-like ROK family protein